MTAIIAILIFSLAYLYGGFSTAQVIAKGFRSLNIYRVGTGLADTENIYSNISRSMGLLVGAIDISKAYLFLMVVEFVLRLLSNVTSFADFSTLCSPTLMMVYGVGMLIGHCLPLTHHFKGGRGIFTYMGFFAYFVFLPVFITAILAMILVWKFKQVRFAQYTIVILPVILYQIFYHTIPWYRKELPPFFTGILIGTAFFMGLLNIIVSKRLGEF
ncbi:MAG: glycerol-3-phosphate acyltransferase [Candidatus Cloacimonetes bacterium]|nr:glycerol-3-phosphate acyltransferase [Candidatus Cloacimonadota bacterium]MDY0228846.1 glycerol-3-phosphate acyltransferase [Candidatus Cloacimonadaceae bacterium]